MTRMIVLFVVFQGMAFGAFLAGRNPVVSCLIFLIATTAQLLHAYLDSYSDRIEARDHREFDALKEKVSGLVAAQGFRS